MSWIILKEITKRNNNTPKHGNIASKKHTDVGRYKNVGSREKIILTAVWERGATPSDLW